MKAVKITNPVWLGNIAPMIKTFTEKINVPIITYETLYAFFAQAVQYGGDLVEFWVVQDSDFKAMAFAMWSVRGLPCRGVVHCNFIYSWNRSRKPIEILLDEFIKFGKRNRCPYYEADTISEELYRVFRLAAHKKGFELNKTGKINFLGRKK